MARMYRGLKGFEDEKWVHSVSRKSYGGGVRGCRYPTTHSVEWGRG